jgi:hypothetical protein
MTLGGNNASVSDLAVVRQCASIVDEQPLRRKIGVRVAAAPRARSCPAKVRMLSGSAFDLGWPIELAVGASRFSRFRGYTCTHCCRVMWLAASCWTSLRSGSALWRARGAVTGGPNKIMQHDRGYTQLAPNLKVGVERAASLTHSRTLVPTIMIRMACNRLSGNGRGSRRPRTAKVLTLNRSPPLTD